MAAARDPEPAAGAGSTETARSADWLTWGVVGVGAVAGVSLILWQSGAFDRSEPVTEFVFTGPTAAALRF